MITTDVDGDGDEDAIVGSRSGHLYAIDVDAGGPSVVWAAYLGAPVVRLGGGDVDGDGENELLVSTEDGLARVLDAIGAAVAIVIPAPTDCITGTRIVVAGTSSAVDTVTVSVQGTVQGTATPNAAGEWSTLVDFPLVDGGVEITAVGSANGVEAVVDSVTIASGVGDADGDGVTVCGGDCDDANPAVLPDADEVCDGLDNDCDPSSEEAIDGDGDGSTNCDDPPDCDDAEALVRPASEEVACEDGLDNDCDGAADGVDTDCGDAPPPPDDPADCGCGGSCAQGAGVPMLASLPLPILVAARRRRRH